MKLSNLIDSDLDIIIYRDNTFSYLDFINSNFKKGVLTFIEDIKYIKNLSSNITCVICSKEVAKMIPEIYGICISDNPRLTFFLIHNYLCLNRIYDKEQYETKIGKSCNISNKACVSNKNVIIGNNVIIEENVIIRENVEIGDNCIIRAGSIIGGEGFQFIKDEQITYVSHSGGVKIGNNVEIQYNTCIDKALFHWDNTVIRNNTKIDNLVHVGHAVKIGKKTMITSGVIIGGSTVIGDNCWLGINATISNGLFIGDNSRISLGAVVTRNVVNNQIVSGNFAIEHKKFIDFIKKINK